MEECFKLLAAFAPAIIIALIIIRKDSVREPRRWLLAAAGVGVASGVAVVLLGLAVFPDFGTETFADVLLTAFFEAAVPEEAVKFAALCIVARYCRCFDQFFDGIVYAVCVGMGFAGFENVLYLFNSDEWITVGIARALLSVPAHYLFAVIMGYYYSLARFCPEKRSRYMALAIVLPVLCHGLFDTLCFSMNLSDTFSSILLIAFILELKYLRRFTRRLIASHLQADCQNLPEL